MKVAVILAGATAKQNKWWWPSFKQADHGVDFDIILAHRNMDGVPEDLENPRGKILFENKIGKQFPNSELEHKAFGVYRHYFQLYRNDYDYFAFVSDDVKIRRSNWLLDAVSMMDRNPQLGFVSPLLFNNPRHIRAPIWFGATRCLEKIKWNFTDDHDGEMNIADQCTDAGFFGVQIGHKIDVAYDPEFWELKWPRVCGNPMPYEYFEKHMFGADHLEKLFSTGDIRLMEEQYMPKLKNDWVWNDILSSPELGIPALQRYNVCLEMQPYHGLIYNPSLHIAEKHVKIYRWEQPIRAGRVDTLEGLFGGIHHSHFCYGISPDNPIAIAEGI